MVRFSPAAEEVDRPFSFRESPSDGSQGPMGNFNCLADNWRNDRSSCTRLGWFVLLGKLLSTHGVYCVDAIHHVNPHSLMSLCIF